MWPFNRFNRLKREDVVSAICDLEIKEQDIEVGIQNKQAQIDELYAKGRVEKSKEVKLFYAKKINHLKQEKQDDLSRGMYLLYNISLMRKLKNAIDDKEFIRSAGKVPLNKLLSNQKGLAQFLNKALNTKIRAEDIMTNADKTFDEVKGMYEPNQEIYGVNTQDDSLLAMFETDSELEMASEVSVKDTQDLESNKSTADI